MPPKPHFKVGDVLIARDNKKSYTCKVINIDKESRTPKYFVHYNGWNRRHWWDKWVDEVTLSRKDSKHQKISSAGDPIVATGELPADQSADGPSDKEIEKANKKRKRDLLMDNLVEEEDTDTQAIKIQLPFPLQKHLVYEWEVISHVPRHLIILPRAFTVSSILTEFLEMKRAKVAAEQMTPYHNLMKELQAYFDQALPVLLLYRQEQEQFDAYIGKDRPSEVYGAEHLLRLFVRMPKLLMQTSLAGSDYNQILSRLGELIKFIHKNSDRLIGKGQYAPIKKDEFPEPVTEQV